jgi:cbb3-type cytochrome oxidase subunit 3
MRQFLQNVDPSLGIYPVIAFLIFSIFFIIMLVWVFSKSKTQIQHLKNMPLDPSDNPSLPQQK